MAVYTQVSDAALGQFLRDYDLGDAVAFKGIAEGVENSNYYLETTQGRYILTLFEKRVKAEDLPYFIGLKQHLAAQGYSCPLPIVGRDGVALWELDPGSAVRHVDDEDDLPTDDVERGRRRSERKPAAGRGRRGQR